MGWPSENILDDIDSIILNDSEIQTRICELAQEISKDYVNKDPILVGVLTGVVPFMADLLKNLSIPMAVDFIAVSQYNADALSGAVRITKDLGMSIEDRHVLFIEDVIDTGLTMNYLLRTLQVRNPASLSICVLFDRPYRRLIDIPLKYQGFELPDEYVVGYGLDANGYYRNLPFVGTLKDEVLAHWG